MRLFEQMPFNVIPVCRHVKAATVVAPQNINSPIFCHFNKKQSLLRAQPIKPKVSTWTDEVAAAALHKSLLIRHLLAVQRWRVNQLC